jgi:hypothetical protein
MIADTLVDAVRKLHWAPAEKADDPDWEAGVGMALNTNNKQMQTRKVRTSKQSSYGTLN